MKTKGNAPQTLPKGHFDSDGKSEGKQSGAVRPTADAQQGARKSSEPNYKRKRH